MKAKRLHYKPIGRDKWLNTKPEKLEEKYYPGELDKKDRPFKGKTFLFNDIIISKGNPNKKK